MCKEDVRIKRKTATRTVRFSSTPAAVTQIFTNNPERCALLVSLWMDGAGQMFNGGCFGPGGTSDINPIGAVTGNTPSVALTIEQIGIALTGEIWCKAGNGASVTTIQFTEVYWIQSLEDIE